MAETTLATVPLAIQATKGLIEYYGAYRSYSKDIERTVTLVEEFLNSLKQIERLIKSTSGKEDGQDAAALKEQLKRNLSTSRKEFETLQAEWDKVRPDPSRSGARAAVKKYGKRVLYPFHKNSLLALQSAVAGARGNIQVSIGASQLQQLRIIQSTAQETTENTGYLKSGELQFSFSKRRHSDTGTQATGRFLSDNFITQSSIFGVD